jgi:hypothetical protein
MADASRCASVEYILFAKDFVGVQIRNKCTKNPSGLVNTYWIELSRLHMYGDVDREQRVRTAKLERERNRLLRLRRRKGKE